MPAEKKVISHLLIRADWAIHCSQLAFGKNQLSKQQVGDILKVLKIFIRVLYNEELESKYETLEAFGKPLRNG